LNINRIWYILILTNIGNGKYRKKERRKIYSTREYAVLVEQVFNSEYIKADDFVRDFSNVLEMGLAI